METFWYTVKPNLCNTDTKDIVLERCPFYTGRLTIGSLMSLAARHPEFNIILKTLSDIVSDQPMFWSDMIGHLIILKRDVVSCHSTRNQNRNNYAKRPKPSA
jgi:hypothetical protein